MLHPSHATNDAVIVGPKMTLLKSLMYHIRFCTCKCLLQYQTKHFCYTQGHSKVTPIAEEVVSFSLVNHCPKHINFGDWMGVVEVNTCGYRAKITTTYYYCEHQGSVTESQHESLFEPYQEKSKGKVKLNHSMLSQVTQLRHLKWYMV